MNDSPLRIVPNIPPASTLPDGVQADDQGEEDVLHLDEITESRAGELEELRRLLVEPEQIQINNVLERLNNPRVRARETSRTLTEAVRLRNAQDKSLTEALEPNVVTAFHNSIKKDPRPVAEAISPLMGPAIRRAIALALSSFVQTIDQTLKHSLSWQGMKWRIEALRTGKQFAEVVLYHTMVYRVEQVFLIHKQTGLLLQHVSADPGATQDVDIVSGMLTAIQVAIGNFARDSFGPSRDGDEEQIDTLDMGDRAVWFESGSQAVLAVVIRGQAPETLRGDFFQPAIEAVHTDKLQWLDPFNGETSAFDDCRPRLEECLQSQYQGRTDPAQFKVPAYIWLLLAAVVIALGVWGFFAWRDARRWNAYLDRLKKEPGVVVAETGTQDGKRFIAGLRDPLAADPLAILSRETPIDPAGVVSRWESYQALDPQFVLARARNLLEPPPTAELKFADGTLSVSGTAPHDWIAESRRLARVLPGVTVFDDQNLIDEDLKEPERLRRQIEQQVIRFVTGGAQIAPGQSKNMQALIADVQQLMALAPAAGRAVRIDIIGHTDTEGDQSLNLSLSQERAARIQSMLISRKINPYSLTATGVGSTQSVRAETSEADKQYNRSVSFKVLLLDPRLVKLQPPPANPKEERR